MIDHLTRLARLVHALRQCATVTSGPHVEDRGRRVVTTQEWFFLGECRISNDNELMHRTRVASGRGSVGDHVEPTDWTPCDLMKASVHWNADELDKLPALPAPGVDGAVDQIMALADGEWHRLGHHTARMVADPKDDDCPWTMEDQSHYAASLVKPLYDGLSDLVFHRERPTA